MRNFHRANHEAPTGYTVKNTFLESCVVQTSSQMRRSKTLGDVPSYVTSRADYNVSSLENETSSSISSSCVFDFAPLPEVDVNDVATHLPCMVQRPAATSEDAQGFQDGISEAPWASWSYEAKTSLEVPKVSDLCRIVTFDHFEQCFDDVESGGDADVTLVEPGHELADEVPCVGCVSTPPLRPVRIELMSVIGGFARSSGSSVDSSAECNPVADPASFAGCVSASPLTSNIHEVC